MSLYDRLAPPEPEFSDAEWDYAWFQVCSELIRDGYTRAEAVAHADDLTIAEQAEHNQRIRRENQAAEAADRRRKDRQEGYL